jgi:hypothetical protein
MIFTNSFSRVRIAAKEKPAPSRERTLKVMKDVGVSPDKFDVEQFRMGLGVEREHDEVTHGDLVKVGQRPHPLTGM